MGTGQSTPPVPQLQSHQTPPHDPMPSPGSPAATHSLSRSPSRCHPVHHPRRDHRPRSPPGPLASHSSHCASAEPAAKQGAALTNCNGHRRMGLNGWDEESNQESTKGGDCRQCSPVELLQTASPPPHPPPPQIIPCGKSFRQGDILWKVHIDSDNIS